MIDVSRYTDTVELVFDIEFITPAFLGGADGDAEIRTAPFKNGIRYWWRILYGAKYFSAGKLKETEDSIFGSTERKSTVDIFIYGMDKNIYIDKKGFPNGKKLEVSHQGKTIRMNILDYLAYGKYKYEKGQGNIYINTYIEPGAKVKMRCLIKKSVYIDEVKDSIKMFILYGGIGSRSRNGFGSMNSDLSGISFSRKVCIVENVNQFPVISSKTYFFRTNKAYGKWEDALSEVGEIYKMARTSLENPHIYENRGFVARPIEVKNERIPDNIRKGRMPKCFHLGVRKYEDKFFGYIFCLPVEFYEKENQKKYEQIYKKMIDLFSVRLKDDSVPFIRQITGDAK